MVYNLYRDIIFIKKKKNTYLSHSHQPLEHKVSLEYDEGRKGRIVEGLNRGTPAVIYVRPIFSAIFPWIYGLLIL